MKIKKGVELKKKKRIEIKWNEITLYETKILKEKTNLNPKLKKKNTWLITQWKKSGKDKNRTNKMKFTEIELNEMKTWK